MNESRADAKFAFFESIKTEAARREEAIRRELDEYTEERKKEADRKAGELYDEYVRRASERISDASGSGKTDSAVRVMRSMRSLRSEITESVFADVRGKLEEFTRTEDYGEMLRESAERMKSICGGAALELHIRPEDAGYASMLKNVSGNISVKADKTGVLGGIYGICASRKLHLDDTLDTRIAAQRDRFIMNSGLVI